MKINKNIFRANDIRGKVGRDLTSKVVEVLGQAFGTYVRNKGERQVLIGRDNRISSPLFKKHFSQGLLSTGCSVLDLGMVSTPVVYFARHHFRTSAALMITGSHNPADYNGFKLCYGPGALAKKEIQEIKEIVLDGSFIKDDSMEGVVPLDGLSAYYDFLQNHFDFKNGGVVVVDGGNSIAGKIALPVLTNLGFKVVPLYCDLDGSFPHHFPDPTVAENLIDLRQKVAEHEAILGVSFDGDGDRLGIVDDKGEIRWGDEMMILFARDILAKEPEATILCEVKCSQALTDEVERLGGRAVMSPTGHSLVEEKMREEKALLAGEMSGHLFFNDRYYGYDDALYATLRLLELVDKAGKKTSDLFYDLPHYVNTSELRIDCSDDRKFKVVDNLKADFKKDDYPMIEVDGARVLFGEGWGLVRASQTEEKLIFRFEGKNKTVLENIISVFEDKVRPYGLLDQGKFFKE